MCKRWTTILNLLAIGGLLSLTACQSLPAGLNVVSRANVPALDAADAPAAPAALASVAWSPDGGAIMIGGRFGLVRYTVSDRKATPFAGMRGAVEALAWSPDGARLASADSAQRVTIWEVATGERLASLNGYVAQMADVAWSPDGGKIAAGSQDGALSIWNATDYQPVATSIYTGTAFIAGLTWSPDGAQLAGIDSSGLYIWDAASGALMKTIAVTGLPALRVAWSADGLYLVTPGPRLWDVATGEEYSTSLFPCSAGSDVVSAVAPDGSGIAEAGTAASGISACIIQVSAAYTETDWIGLALNPYAESLSALAWSPNAQQLAGATQDGWLYLWDAATGDLLAVAAPPTLNQAHVKDIIRACVPNDALEISLTRQLIDGSYQEFIDAVLAQPDEQMRPGCESPLIAMAEFFIDNPPQLQQSPAAPQALTLQGFCSPQPDEYRVWIVSNPNSFDVRAYWRWDGAGAPPGGYPFVIPAATGAVPGVWQLALPPEADTLRIESGNFVATAASVSSPCVEYYLPLVLR
jgi:WD40 repeat protein